MISVELAGGLGNQMFEYAFIFAQHKKLNAPFYLTKSGSTILLYEYFNLQKNLYYNLDRILFDHKGYKLLFSHYFRGFFYNLVSKKLTSKLVIDNTEDPITASKKVRNSTIYSGYFQSEFYFEDAKEEVRNLFSLKSKFIYQFNEKFGWLKRQSTVVAVHIRRNDYKSAFEYLNLGSADLSIPLSYYHNLIEQIHKEDNFYVFILDEIENIKDEFAYLKNVYFSNESEIMDFQLMLNANICVIANSSFSWWAAYLNDKEKVVYCPKYYLGFLKSIEYPNQIYPKEWIQIPVNGR